jgi:hypothetical protein
LEVIRYWLFIESAVIQQLIEIYGRGSGFQPRLTSALDQSRLEVDPIRTLQIFHKLKMTKLNQNRIRKVLIRLAFFFLASMVISVYSLAEEVLLIPPGMRSVKDPSFVIPAGYHYRNKLVELPSYRDAAGKPADGWSNKYVGTRRFVSNQSAWIYFRHSDLKQSVETRNDAEKRAFRIWPIGATLVIESYHGTAIPQTKDELTQIDVMVKINAGSDSSSRAFYPANWVYTRFKPDGSPAITSDKVRECHQCHSIAFHLTGDLVFTQFP